jgi:hypothetical protein
MAIGPDIDIQELKDGWCGRQFDEVTFEVDPKEMVEFAVSCGETQPRFTDPEHPDFQAPPSYTSRFHGRRSMPDDFPIQAHQGFDAGKCVEVFTPLRPGDKVIARSEIHDIYVKTGRSGGMLFIVHRMRFSNQNDELISVVDWRLVQNQVSRKAPREAGQ